MVIALIIFELQFLFLCPSKEPVEDFSAAPEGLLFPAYPLAGTRASFPWPKSWILTNSGTEANMSSWELKPSLEKGTYSPYKNLYSSRNKEIGTGCGLAEGEEN